MIGLMHININGIMQSTEMYSVEDISIKFHQAPSKGDDVRVVLPIPSTSVRYMGDGEKCVFTLPSDVGKEIMFKEFMDSVWKHRNNPSVKDQLEKLKIIMELVR